MSQSKVTEEAEKLCTQRNYEKKERVDRGGSGGGLEDSDDESLAISCSSPCLSAAVIASGCSEIIAFQFLFLALSFPPITHLLSYTFSFFSLLLDLMISHSLVIFQVLGLPVELCQAFFCTPAPSFSLGVHDGNLIDKCQHSLNPNVLYCRARSVNV